MKKEELLNKLKECEHKYGDAEGGHEMADKFLLEYIDDEEISKAFESLERWYA